MDYHPGASHSIQLSVTHVAYSQNIHTHTHQPENDCSYPLFLMRQGNTTTTYTHCKSRRITNHTPHIQVVGDLWEKYMNTLSTDVEEG